MKALIAVDPSLAEPLVEGLPYVRAEAVHAVRHEMATTLDDVLARRTRVDFHDRAVCLGRRAEIADLSVASWAGLPAMWRDRLDNYRAMCAAELAAATAGSSA